MINVILKRFEAPDETRVLTKGEFEIVRLGGLTIGRATYEPGWKWSLHIGQQSERPAAQSSTSAWYFRVLRPQRLRTKRS
jgi:hypothetical protein